MSAHLGTSVIRLIVMERDATQCAIGRTEVEHDHEDDSPGSATFPRFVISRSHQTGGQGPRALSSRPGQGPPAGTRG